MIADRSFGAGRGAREHWYTDDQFERQLGNAAHAAVIHRRWNAFAAALQRFSQQMTAGHPVRVLDAGCGDGINLVGLRRILTDLGVPWHLVAVDMNPVRIERARAADRAAGCIAFGSVTALPFDRGAFDVVLCNHVMEHVPQPESAAVEIARVLRPGGMAMIGVPNEGSAFGRLRNRVLQRSILKATDHTNFFTRDSLSRLLDRAGLEVDDVRGAGFMLPHLRVHGLVAATSGGRALLDAAGRLMPSQVGELFAIARRRS
jgi:2-polyprenyl-3-methyl-5-hydroxy-6-metoxy-1,4-benzoquinol methylase